MYIQRCVYICIYIYIDICTYIYIYIDLYLGASFLMYPCFVRESCAIVAMFLQTMPDKLGDWHLCEASAFLSVTDSQQSPR